MIQMHCGNEMYGWNCNAKMPGRNRQAQRVVSSASPTKSGSIDMTNINHVH